MVEALGEVKKTGLVIDRDDCCSFQNVTLASEHLKTVKKKKFIVGKYPISWNTITTLIIQILGKN